MFALLAGPAHSVPTALADLVASQLRSGPSPRLWLAADGSAAAAATVAGLLEEDHFDQQPLLDKDHLVFTCRARIDNRQELQQRLGLPPAEAASMADSTLLYLAYRRWGCDCGQELTGDYAYVAWHPQERRVAAGIDHSGNSRLYWTLLPGGIGLAGQMDALLAHPSVSRAPDLPALAKVMDSGIDRSTTPYQAVRSLPGGCVLHWQAEVPSEVRVTRWWRPATEARVFYAREQDYADHIAELLDRVIKAQLRAAGPVASSLSGGLDSGLVTAMAARELARRGRRLSAYTAVPEPALAREERPGWDADDGPYASAVAALHANVDHHAVTPGERCMLDVLPHLLRSGTGPMKNISNMVWADRISQGCHAAGHRVILEGQMGNATVSYSGDGAIRELIKLHRPVHAVQLAQAESRASGRPTGRVLAAAALGPFKQALLQSFQLQATTTVATNTCIREELRPTPEGRGRLYSLPTHSRELWTIFATQAKHAWRPDPVLLWGVEWRDPLSDRRLIETLLSFPLAAFRLGGRPRGLARALGVGLLPDAVRLRQTRGSQLPELPGIIRRARARYYSAIEALDASPLCRTLLDIDALRARLHAICAGNNRLALALELERALSVGQFLLNEERHT